jgi:hypothetical protein
VEEALAERAAGLLWRLRRVERFESLSVAADQAALEIPPRPRSTEDSIDQMLDEDEDAMTDEEGGDESAMPLLRRAMDIDGVLIEAAGNMAAQAEGTLIRHAAGKNLLFKEATERKMDRLRKDLAGDSPTPLERLLADRITLCWLALHDAEIRFAQSKDLTIKQAEFWQKRIDYAHRRYLSAIKTLATVRKLAVPALQVNIARKQVNVVNSGAAEG